MIDITKFFADNDRVRIYRAGVSAENGRYVLYWMQRSQRGQDNSALNAAIALGNALQLPVVVLFVLSPYPAANLRHYTFTKAWHTAHYSSRCATRRGRTPCARVTGCGGYQ